MDGAARPSVFAREARRRCSPVASFPAETRRACAHSAAEEVVVGERIAGVIADAGDGLACAVEQVRSGRTFKATAAGGVATIVDVADLRATALATHVARRAVVVVVRAIRTRLVDLAASRRRATDVTERLGILKPRALHSVVASGLREHVAAAGLVRAHRRRVGRERQRGLRASDQPRDEDQPPLHRGPVMYAGSGTSSTCDRIVPASVASTQPKSAAFGEPVSGSVAQSGQVASLPSRKPL